MSKKRVSYQNLLKNAIAEFDTSKTVDVKGPMLDPILSWDGDGELPVQKDAAGILERYYFNETADHGVEVSEMEYNEDGTEKSTASEKDAKGAGTEQAGTSEKGSIKGEKEEIKKDLAKEEVEVKTEAKEEKEEDETEEKEDEKEDEKEEAVEESQDVTEDIENAVIEKLIAEMEEEDEDETEDKEEVSEMETSYTGEGPHGPDAPKEKKAKTAMDDSKGAGTEQAGTGTANDQVPDRKDNADKMVKAKNYSEAEEVDAADAEEEKDLDVDKEIKEAGAIPGGPSPKKTGEDVEDDVYEEAFRLFQESIEDTDETDEEDNKE